MKKVEGEFFQGKANRKTVRETQVRTEIKGQNQQFCQEVENIEDGRVWFKN